MMFEEESHWNIDQSADRLNQSLFGEVPVDVTNTKKKISIHAIKIDPDNYKSNLARGKNKARLRNKYPAAQTIAIKENSDLSLHVPVEIDRRKNDVKSFNKKKNVVKVLSGDSEVTKKGKRKKTKTSVVSEIPQSTKVPQTTKVGTKKDVGVNKSTDSAGTPLACEEGHSPNKKRRKNRKRKPKNKFAHLVQKKDPALVESSIDESEKQSFTQPKQIDLSLAASSPEIGTKVCKVKKSKLQNGGEHSVGKRVLLGDGGSVSLELGLTKKKRKNKKQLVTVNQNESEGSMDIRVGSPKEAVVETRSAKKRNKKRKLLSEMKGSVNISERPATVKSQQEIAVNESSKPTNTAFGTGKKTRNRKRKHQIDDESVDVLSKKQKVAFPNVDDDSGVQESTQESPSGKKKRNKKTKSNAKTVDTKSVNAPPKIAVKKSVSTSSPFDVSELRKRLSIGGDSPGAKVVKGVGKNVAKEGPKVEIKKKEPQTLRERMMEKLNSARFRAINEQLYTCSGKEAYTLFEEDPSTFKVYHEGFQNQVDKWPVNPVDKMIEYIQSKSNANLVVADFGCGDAKIAQSVFNKVHSFDLVAVNKHITACDMSKVPLRSNCVDIGIFCLSLMGTNLVDYLHEAHRIMKTGGVLLIAEVVSRIERVNIFIHQVEALGFMLMHKDKSNKMFILFEFKKAHDAPPKHRLEPIELLPCVYKKR